MPTPNHPYETYVPRHLDVSSVDVGSANQAELAELALATARGRGEELETTAGNIAARLTHGKRDARGDALQFLALVNRGPSDDPGHTRLWDFAGPDHPQQVFERDATLVHRPDVGERAALPAQRTGSPLESRTVRPTTQPVRRTGGRPRVGQ